MQIELNRSYHGFRLLEEKHVKEVNSLVRLFMHEKSGAKLLHMENDDDNRVFSITFRTPPPDSTGLPHILEHSVLCGSRKYPTKEPFVELVKGSLNTFLNAFTFPDKTMYPVASRNEKDFFNLMDVYLDAVFHPNIYKYPEILKQEGWHYELDSDDGDITYKGVVYNEMKGAFSSPDSVLMRKIQETLFPDTPYGKESGGDPEVIPQLTQAEFIAFHKKYYHPSNSYLFLYGNGNLLEQLDFIDSRFLKDFDKAEVDSQLPLQKPYKALHEAAIPYPVSANEETKEKTYFSLNFVVGTATEPETCLAMEVLEHILLGTPASPLKKALVEAGLGKDVFGKYDSSILQPVFSIVIKNSEPEKKAAFTRIVFETLERLTREGLDKKLVEAAINVKEFHLREADFESYPKGLIYNIKAMDSWLYDASPTIHLEYEPLLEKIKTALNGDYFEEMIKRYFLNNTHSSLLILEPKQGMAEAKAEETRKMLADLKASLSKNQLKALVEQTAALKAWQNKAENPAELEKIPLLTLADISTKSEALQQELRSEAGIKILQHPLFTNGIAYIDLLFDTASVPQPLLPYIPLLASVLGKVSTEKYSYTDLSNEINIHTGEIRFSVQIFGEKENEAIYHPKLTAKGKALMTKLPRLLEIMGEIIAGSRADDKRRLKEIIQEIKSRMEIRISNEGYPTACKRLFSYYSEEGAYIEAVTGLTYYKFIADIERNFENRLDTVIESLKQVADIVFNKSNLVVGVTCEEKDYEAFRQNLPLLLGRLGDKTASPAKYRFELSVKNEGLMTQSKVQYVAKGYNFIKLGYAYTGSIQVLKTIARYTYLWSRIRVQGGAYGAFSGFERNGNMFMVSYRDPNLKETLQAYDELPQYLEQLDISDREMTKYIIGTISKIDLPLTPYMKGERAIEYYFRRISAADIQREREEILKTKQTDIRKLSDMMREIALRNCYCVLGSEIKIKENKALFNGLVQVFE